MIQKVNVITVQFSHSQWTIKLINLRSLDIMKRDMPGNADYSFKDMAEYSLLLPLAASVVMLQLALSFLRLL